MHWKNTHWWSAAQGQRFFQAHKHTRWYVVDRKHLRNGTESLFKFPDGPQAERDAIAMATYLNQHQDPDQAIPRLCELVHNREEFLSWFSDLVEIHATFAKKKFDRDVLEAVFGHEMAENLWIIIENNNMVAQQAAAAFASIPSARDILLRRITLTENQNDHAPGPVPAASDS